MRKLSWQRTVSNLWKLGITSRSWGCFPDDSYEEVPALSPTVEENEVCQQPGGALKYILPQLYGQMKMQPGHQPDCSLVRLKGEDPVNLFLDSWPMETLKWLLLFSVTKFVTSCYTAIDNWYNMQFTELERHMAKTNICNLIGHQ